MKKLLLFIFYLAGLCSLDSFSQVSYNSAVSFSLRKTRPLYVGSAIQVRRTCDNAVKDIGFNSCGDIDTNDLKTFVIAANPLSATTATAAAAFSLRRLRCTYAGSAIRVRRSSDNTTLDIGFTSWGDLDTVAMKAFVTVNNAFVTTWYDQSGNGRNATQATAGNQPRIMLAGVIERQNNQPAIKWLGMGYALVTAGFTTFGTAACFNGVAKVNANVTFNCIVNKCTNNFPAPIDFYNSSHITGNGVSATFFLYAQTFNAAQPMAIWTYQGNSGGTARAYFNSTLSVSGAVVTWADNGNPLFLGSRFDGLTGLNGWISEVITFDALPSATDRAFIEWSQSAYYSISGIGLFPVPVGAASGFVTTWYDQSGSGLNATQVANANQPRIINAGVIEKSGTKSAIRFLGFPATLTLTTPVSSYPISISCLANTGGVTTNGAFVKLGGITAGSSGVGLGVGATGTNYDNTGFSIIGLKESQVFCPSSPGVNWSATPFIVTETQQSAGGGSGMAIFLNGTNVPLNLANNITDGASITGLLSIGGYSNVTLRHPLVKETEVHIFGSALNVTRRTLLETNQAAHNNIAISNSKYTPPTPTTYNLYVNGVGRETATDSVAGTRQSVGMGFTIGNTATDFLKDNGDYITAGVGCPLSATTSVLNLPGTVVERWLNDWYVNKTDVGANNGNLSFYFNFPDYGIIPLPGAAANYRLLYRSGPAATFTIVPGSTSSVAGSRVQFLVDASNVTTNYYYTIGTTNVTLSPLPIEMTEFTAQKAGKEVNVFWSTATEKNTDFFTVQRSSDATYFTDLDNVKAAGNSSSEKKYSFVDIKPLPNISYYRLKQVDLDKSFTFSKIVYVNFENEFFSTIYPNPTNGYVDITNCKQFSKLVVQDLLGRLAYKAEVSGESMNVDLSGLPSGEYFLTLYNLVDQNKFTSKIIIQKEIK